jgi:hypothetical protein
MILAIESDKCGTGISITNGESIIGNKEVSVKGGGRASTIQNCIDPIKETDYTGKIRDKYKNNIFRCHHTLCLLEHLPATTAWFSQVSPLTRDVGMIFPKKKQHLRPFQSSHGKSYPSPKKSCPVGHPGLTMCCKVLMALHIVGMSCRTATMM